MNVMLDLETLSTHNFAVILSIGACKFEPQLDGISDSFYVRVDPESCQKIGLRIDAPTVMWWLSPERDEGRKKLLAPPEERWDIHDALDGFAQWYGRDPLPTWGNGAGFDNVIIRNAFTLAGMECPWGFRDDRCFRTLKVMSGGLSVPHVGTAHDALDDAVHQAKLTQAILKHIGVML